MIVPEINIKLSIFGAWGVGKTSITNSFLNKEIPNMYIPTIGSNIIKKEYKLHNCYLKVNIWDIGGQRSFNPLNPIFFSNIDIALLVFDLTNPKETLMEIKQTYLKNLRTNSPDCLILIVGNKSDLVKPEDTDILLNNIRQTNLKEFPLIFISAKTTANLSEAFELLILDFLEKWEIQSNSERFRGIHDEFLKLIDKNKDNLSNLIINLDEVDSTTLEKKINPKIVKKRVSSRKNEIKIELHEINYSDFQANLVDYKLIKNSIIGTFNNNIKIVEDLLLGLKTCPIEFLIERIEKTSQELSQLKEDFEVKLDGILNLTTKRKN